VAFCADLVDLWGSDLSFALDPGHPMAVGHAVLDHLLEPRRRRFNELQREGLEPLPHLAALVCLSAFDLAMHDAYGVLHNVPTYDTYNGSWMNHDLAHYLDTARDATTGFHGRYPADFLVGRRPDAIPAWHLVGGKDPVTPGELTGQEPDDGHPVLLRDWIRRDGLRCLKVKLTGTDAAWDYRRLIDVGALALEEDCYWLTADFNCTVEDPAYVTDILDRLMIEYPRISGMVLYVEQPFPYDLSEHPIVVNAVSARKPLFLDESAHDWRVVRLGRSLGWTGVALKTCKTQTGALLSQAWAKAHGMTLMVQDLTNPMLAQIPHLQLGARAGTIMGVETNGMQFYPEASGPEAAVHPGAFRRRDGMVRLDTIGGPGLGYRIGEIHRDLPEPVAVAEA
jgi:L-alanine-DL-glutamate epimerase-like enolase superfamily enzyme